MDLADDVALVADAWVQLNLVQACVLQWQALSVYVVDAAQGVDGALRDLVLTRLQLELGVQMIHADVGVDVLVGLRVAVQARVVAIHLGVLRDEHSPHAFRKIVVEEVHVVREVAGLIERVVGVRSRRMRWLSYRLQLVVALVAAVLAIRHSERVLRQEWQLVVALRLLRLGAELIGHDHFLRADAVIKLSMQPHLEVLLRRRLKGIPILELARARKAAIMVFSLEVVHDVVGEVVIHINEIHLIYLCVIMLLLSVIALVLIVDRYES